MQDGSPYNPFRNYPETINQRELGSKGTSLSHPSMLSADKLFSVDILTGIKFEQNRTSHYRTGEYNLALRVFEDGLKEALVGQRTEVRRRGGSEEDAQEWIFGEFQDYTHSFENLCELFTLDVEQIRRRIRSLLQLPLAEREKFIGGFRADVTSSAHTKVRGEAPGVGKIF